MTLFLDRGAHIDDQDDRGRTALMIAAELNHAAAVDLLLAHDADKTVKDKQGKTASDLTSLTALRDKLAATRTNLGRQPPPSLIYEHRGSGLPGQARQ
jgi:ankyrin repeat protein